MRCPNCGAENKDGELFCHNCETMIAAEMPVIGEEYLDEVFAEQPALRLEPVSDETAKEFWHSVQWINTPKREEKAAPVEEFPMIGEAFEAIPMAALSEEPLEAIPMAALSDEEPLEAIPMAALSDEEPLEAIPVAALSEEPLDAMPVYAPKADRPEKVPETAGKRAEAVPMEATMEEPLRFEPVAVSEKRWSEQKKPAQDKPRQERERRPRRDGNQKLPRDEGKNQRNDAAAPRNPQGGDAAFKKNAAYSDVTSRVKGEAKGFVFTPVQITEEPPKRKSRKTDETEEPEVTKKPKKDLKQMLPWVIAMISLLLLLIVLFVRCDGTPPAETTDPVQTGGASVQTPVDTDPAGTSEPEMPTEQTVPETKEPVYETVYRVIAGDVSWEEAKRECEARGGTLATITSAEEFDAVCAEANKSGLTYLWLGARLEGNDWAEQTWITGEKMTFTKWYTGEPSYVDTGDNVEESCLCMWKVKKDVNDWTFNDQRNDPIKDYPKQFSGKIGYVLELEVEVTE